MNTANNKLPSLDEIKSYQQGAMDDAQRLSLEQAADNNPLLSEAMEGFAQKGGYHAVPDLSQFLGLAAQTTAAATASSVVAAKTGSILFSAKALMVAAVVATTATVTTIAIVSTDENETPSVTQAIQQTTAMTNDSNETPAANSWKDQNTGIAEKTISDNDRTSLPANAANNDATAEQATGDEGVITGTVAETIPLSDAQKAAEQLASDAVKTNLKYKAGEVAVSTTYINHYKVADYTDMVKAEWPSFETELSGVPAPYASEEEKKKAEEENSFTNQIAYMDYMRQCIRAMDQKQYALAIEKFAIISAQYPDDVNARFYTGYCHYESSNYPQAIACFEITMTNMIWTFDEPAEFYKAKCMKAQGNVEEAKILFRSIAEKGKFYAQQARKELE
ncbi:MAG: tetratricopeptide repeat protein [Flavobacteriales bacterium]